MSDVQGAAARLSGLLEKQEMRTEENAPEAQDEQAKEQDAAPEEDNAELETPTEDESEGDTEAKRKLYKVKDEGEELQVDEDELINGYRRERHHQRNMKKLNEQREAIEAKAQQVDQQLAEAQSVLEFEISELESPEMLELKEDDADAYIKAVDKVKAKLHKFEQTKAKRAEEHQKRLESLQTKQKELLVDAFPEWSDSESFQKGQAELNDVLYSMGIKEDELSSTAGVDHRMYLIANEIREGRKAKAELDAIRKANLEAREVKTKPKSVKPGTLQTKEHRESADVKKMRDRLKQTGSIHDAVAIIRN